MQRLQALDLVLAQRPEHALRGLLAVDVPDDQLGDHRVVHRRDLGAGADARVDAHAGPGRLAVGRRSCPGAGAKFFDASSALIRHSIAWPRSTTSSWVMDSGSPAATRMPSLTMSMPGDHLGHAVLDLDARVHLQEEVLAVLEQALDRAGADVVDGARGLDGDLADALAHLVVDGRRGRLLDQLLVAALDRAVALAEVDDVAVAVGQDLDLDVARVGQVALEVDGRVGEELLALARGALERGLELVLVEGDAEALAAAAARRLDRDRVADVVGDDLAGVLDGLDGFGRAGHDRHAGLGHQLAGAGLGAHRLDRAGRRPDEHDARVLAGLGEGRVLRQEAVAGVDGLGARLAAHLEDPLDVEVALGRRRAAEQVRLVGAPTCSASRSSSE